MRKLEEDQRSYRASVSFPPDVTKLIQSRANADYRSFSNEVVRLVKAQLEQETKKELLETAPTERS